MSKHRNHTITRASHLRLNTHNTHIVGFSIVLLLWHRENYSILSPAYTFLYYRWVLLKTKKEEKEIWLRYFQTNKIIVSTNYNFNATRKQKFYEHLFTFKIFYKHNFIIRVKKVIAVPDLDRRNKVKRLKLFI